MHQACCSHPSSSSLLVGPPLTLQKTRTTKITCGAYLPDGAPALPAGLETHDIGCRRGGGWILWPLQRFVGWIHGGSRWVLSTLQHSVGWIHVDPSDPTAFCGVDPWWIRVDPIDPTAFCGVDPWWTKVDPIDPTALRGLMMTRIPLDPMVLAGASAHEGSGSLQDPSAYTFDPSCFPTPAQDFAT
jgi:hypothetical protein